MNDQNIPNNPLSTLRADIRKHWKKYLPRMTSRLEQAGKLEERIEEAARQTEEAVLGYVQTAQGSTITPAQAFWQAWEIYRNEWAFLPAESKPAEDDDEDNEDETGVSLSSIYDLYRDYYKLREEERERRLAADDDNDEEDDDVHDEA